MDTDSIAKSPVFLRALDKAFQFIWSAKIFIGGQDVYDYSKFIHLLGLELVKDNQSTLRNLLPSPPAHPQEPGAGQSDRGVDVASAILAFLEKEQDDECDVAGDWANRDQATKDLAALVNDVDFVVQAAQFLQANKPGSP
eukprot:7670700-Alexandrium_andersonii.AAC.1